jgi:hypothetical protein
MSIDQIGSDQTPCSAQPGLAVDSNSSVLYCDGFVRNLDKLSYERQRRAGAILKNHIHVIDP